jgi:hypothetical protein
MLYLRLFIIRARFLLLEGKKTPPPGTIHVSHLYILVWEGYTEAGNLVRVIAHKYSPVKFLTTNRQSLGYFR